MSCLNPPNRLRMHCVTRHEITFFIGLFPHLQRSEIVGSSSDIFGNVRKSSEHRRKSRSEDENLKHLTQEKLAGIPAFIFMTHDQYILYSKKYKFVKFQSVISPSKSCSLLFSLYELIYKYKFLKIYLL